MGTIAIEGWQSVGHENGENEAGVYDGFVGGKDDATTSASAETFEVDGSAGFVSVYAVERHRACWGSDLTGTAGEYFIIEAGERREFSVPGSERTFYYRTDAA